MHELKAAGRRARARLGRYSEYRFIFEISTGVKRRLSSLIVISVRFFFTLTMKITAVSLSVLLVVTCRWQSFIYVAFDPSIVTDSGCMRGPKPSAHSLINFNPLHTPGAHEHL